MRVPGVWTSFRSGEFGSMSEERVRKHLAWSGGDWSVEKDLRVVAREGGRRRVVRAM